MTKETPLFLHEKIMLLALHDDKGTISSDNYPYAIAGAVLAELLLTGRLLVSEERSKKYVELQNDKPLGDEVVDECLRKVAEAKRRATLETWVERFANLNNLKHRVARRLCERGILRADEDTILWIFTRKVYPELDPVPEKALIKQLQHAVFTDAKDVDPRTVVMVSLANGTGLLQQAFDKKELKSRKQRIEDLVNGDLVGKATKEVIESVQAAVMVAVMMPIIMTTVINN